MHDTQDQWHGLVHCADDRDDGALRAGAGSVAATGAAWMPDRVLAALELTDDVEALVAACLAELRLAIPQLRPWHGKLSGRRVLGAHAPPERDAAAARGVLHGVTRVDVEFEVELDVGQPARVALACRSTLRGRDRDGTATRIEIAPGDAGRAGRQQLSAWVEDALLEFAGAWFETRRLEAERVL